MLLLVASNYGDGSFRLVGELDPMTVEDVAPALECHLTRDGDVILDLSELSFMGSEEVRLFIDIARHHAGKGRLVLVDPSPLVRRALDLTCLEPLPNLEIHT